MFWKNTKKANPEKARFYYKYVVCLILYTLVTAFFGAFRPFGTGQ